MRFWSHRTGQVEAIYSGFIDQLNQFSATVAPLPTISG